MIKLGIGVIALSFLLGTFMGAHLPHVQKIQAVREFYARNRYLQAEEVLRLCEELKKGRQTNFDLHDFLTELDFHSDMVLLSCLPVPPSIKSQTNAQLYSNIEYDELYGHMRDWVISTAYQHDCVKARKLAALALCVRGPGELHSSNRETTFASSLNRISFFSEAEKVLKELPPVDKTVFQKNYIKENEELNRLMELECSLVSQRKYQQVVDIPRKSEREKYTGYYGLALVGLHRDKEALQILRCHLINADSAQEFGLFVELCKPTGMTSAKKTTLEKKAKQLLEYKMKDDYDSVAFLQLAADRLKDAGLDEASNEMKANLSLNACH